MNSLMGILYSLSLDGEGMLIEFNKTKPAKISMIIVDSNAIFLINIYLLVFNIIYLKHNK